MTQPVKIRFIDERPPIWGIVLKETPQAYVLNNVITREAPYTEAEQEMAEVKDDGLDMILVQWPNVYMYERHHIFYVEQLPELPRPDLQAKDYSGGGVER